MIAQIILTGLLGGILIYAWTERRRSPAIGLTSMLVAAGGLYFVWLPAHASALAELAGVGRGVDLIIYVWVVISLLVALNIHLKLRAQLEMITTLAREIALLNAHLKPAQSAQGSTSSPSHRAPPDAG